MTKPKRGFAEGYKTYDTSNGYGNSREWKNAFHKTMGRDEAKTILDAEPDTPEDILGVRSGASISEIKKAFRDLIMKWHPDRNPGQEELATKMSQKIIAAYTMLT
jgi:DnaJ-domain-containing protein 1